MTNFEKRNIFKIEKVMKAENNYPQDRYEEKPYTFKVTKKRSPWSLEEDEAITELVNKYGTGNWTVIANELANAYGFKNRSGKQCRERWHNHLDPNINKDYWTEKEENILFSKHMEYGNKWSDIARFLPGRTDNSIKNHFYSKLRKFIRKILKQINKENLIKANNIDPNKYNSDKIYKMIKKFKIPYNSLNKDSVLNMVINVEKNGKAGKAESARMLRQKTARKRSKVEERANLYSEKVTKRNKPSQVQVSLKGRIRRKPLNYEVEEEQQEVELDFEKSYINSRVAKSNSEEIELDYDSDITEQSLNIIINKSVLFNKYLKEEEEKKSTSSGQRSTKQELTQGVSEQKKESFTPLVNPLMHNLNMMTDIPSTTHANLVLDDRIYLRNSEYPYIDNLPLISPLNPGTRIYPPSTRNYFNIDFGDGNFSMPFVPNCNMYAGPRPYVPYNLITTPKESEVVSLRQTPTNKEVTLQNKILIKQELKNAAKEKEQKAQKDKQPQDETSNKGSQRPKLNLDLVNESDTGKIFAASVCHSHRTLNTPEEKTLQDDKESIKDEVIDNQQPKKPDEGKENPRPTYPMKATLNISPKSAFVYMK